MLTARGNAKLIRCGGPAATGIVQRQLLTQADRPGGLIIILVLVTALTPQCPSDAAVQRHDAGRQLARIQVRQQVKGGTALHDIQQQVIHAHGPWRMYDSGTVGHAGLIAGRRWPQGDEVAGLGARFQPALGLQSLQRMLHRGLRQAVLMAQGTDRRQAFTQPPALLLNALQQPVFQLPIAIIRCHAVCTHLCRFIFIFLYLNLLRVQA